MKRKDYFVLSVLFIAAAVTYAAMANTGVHASMPLPQTAIVNNTVLEQSTSSSDGWIFALSTIYAAVGGALFGYARYFSEQ